LVVDDGRVNCPRRGDTDVEQCFFCAELADIREDADGEFTICCRALGNIMDDRAFAALL
jgi:hypothetical protein